MFRMFTCLPKTKLFQGGGYGLEIFCEVYFSRTRSNKAIEWIEKRLLNIVCHRKVFCNQKQKMKNKCVENLRNSLTINYYC